MTTSGVKSAMEGTSETDVNEVEKPREDTSMETYGHVNEQQQMEQMDNDNTNEQQELVADAASDTSTSNSGRNSPSELKSGQENNEKEAAPSENGENTGKLPMDAVLTLIELNAGWRK